MSNLTKAEFKKPGADIWVYIATPAHTIFANFHVSLLRNVLKLVEAGVSVTYAHLSGHPHVDDARNLLVADFLKSKATHLLFWDGDVAAEPGAVQRLLAHDLNLVGGAYPLKDGSGKFPVRGHRYDPPGGPMFAADVAPTGFLCIKRGLIELLAHSATRIALDGTEVPIIFERGIVDGERVGGDAHFCVKAKREGAQAYIEPHILFTHAGVVDFAGRLSDHLGAS